MSSTKFAVVSTSFVVICTVAGTVVTIGTALGITSEYDGVGIAATSATAIAVIFQKASDSTGYRQFFTVSGTTPTGGTITQYTTDPVALYHSGVVALDEFRVLNLWTRNTPTTAIKVGAFFMRGTYSRLYFYSSGLRFSWFNSQGEIGRVDSDYVAAAATWWHISINNDQANKKIHYTVSQTETNHDYSAETLVTTAATLTLNLPEAAYAAYLDDLLVLPGVYLNYSTASEISELWPAWVDWAIGIDNLLDLVLVAKSGGVISVQSPLVASSTINATSRRALKENIRAFDDDAPGILRRVKIERFLLKADPERSERIGSLPMTLRWRWQAESTTAWTTGTSWDCSSGRFSSCQKNSRRSRESDAAVFPIPHPSQTIWPVSKTLALLFSKVVIHSLVAHAPQKPASGSAACVVRWQLLEAPADGVLHELVTLGKAAVQIA